MKRKMTFNATKIKVNNKIYEKGTDNIESILIDITERTITINYQKDDKWDSKIIFLENTKEIEYKIEILDIDPQMEI